jgi:hypothetical protein
MENIDLLIEYDEMLKYPKKSKLVPHMGNCAGIEDESIIIDQAKSIIMNRIIPEGIINEYEYLRRLKIIFVDSHSVYQSATNMTPFDADISKCAIVTEKFIKWIDKQITNSTTGSYEDKREIVTNIISKLCIEPYNKKGNKKIIDDKVSKPLIDLIVTGQTNKKIKWEDSPWKLHLVIEFLIKERLLLVASNAIYDYLMNNFTFKPKITTKSILQNKVNRARKSFAYTDCAALLSIFSAM